MVAGGDSTVHARNLDDRQVEGDDSDSADRSGAGAGSPENSDFYLDKLKELEDSMRHGAWGRVFKRWREHEGAARKYPASEYAVYGTGAQEAHWLPKLRGINWGMLESASGKLAELASNREAWQGHLGSLDKQLDQAWRGKAADAAREQYLAVKKPLNEYCDALDRTSRALDMAVRVPREQIGPGGLSDFKNKSEFFKNYGSDDQSEDIIQDIAGMEKIVAEGMRESLSGLRSMGQFGQRLIPQLKSKVDTSRSNAPGDTSEYERVDLEVTWDDLRVPGGPDCRHTLGVWAQCSERIKWLDTFCGWYAHDVKALRKRIDEAYTHTERAFTELKKQLDRLDGDALTNLGASDSGSTGESPYVGEGDRPDQRGTDPGRGGGSRADGAGAVGNGSGGTANVSGGGTTAGMPGESAAAEGTGAAPGDMSVPGDGAGENARPGPAEAPAARGPDVPSGAASSEDGAARDEVTFGEGTERITVREPDSQGSAQLTLLDEQGRERTYEIAFGDSRDGQSAAEEAMTRETASRGEEVRAGTPLTPGGVDPAASGESAGPRTMPGQTGEAVGNQPGASAPDAAGAVTTVHPNEDGTAVIEQGDRSIEVERTPDGRLQLSVDDGGDQPSVTRTVDFGQDDGSRDSPDSVGAGAATEQPVVGGQESPQPGEGNTQPSGGDARPNGEEARRAATSVAGGADNTAGPVPEAPAEGPNVAGEALGRDAYAEAASEFRQAGTPEAPAGQQGADPLDSPAGTTSQWAGDNMFTESQSDGPRRTFTAFSGDLFSSAEETGGSVWGDRPNNQAGEASGATGLPSMEGRADRTDSQGATGLASMGESGGAGQSEQGAGRGGGMMPMGGMGAGAGQQGGDEERSNDSPWRTEGNLFDDGIDASADWQYSAVLGEQEGK